MRSLNIRCSQSAEGVELAILGDITAYTAEEIMRAMNFFRDQPVTITMMSGGGDAFASLGLYDFIKGKDVTVRIYGIAASGAAIVSAAARRVEMAASAFLMIHNAYGPTEGQGQDILDAMNERQAELFAARSGQTKGKVRKMLADETFMDAATAKELGFADVVFDPLKMAASLNTMTPMSEVIKEVEETTEEQPIITAEEIRNAPIIDLTEEKQDEEQETTEVEVEVPVTAVQAAKAALSGSIRAKVKVNVAANYATIVAALTDEVKAIKAQLDERVAEVEALTEKAEQVDQAKADAEAAKAAAEAAQAEVEKLKTTPLEDGVKVEGGEGVQAPGTGAAAQGAQMTAHQQSVKKTLDALDRKIAAGQPNK